MLDHLYTAITAAIMPVQRATLATSGPAGLLAHVLPCVADGVRLFLLLPQTSDHLLNIEASPTVAIATDAWRMLGNARILGPELSFALPYFDNHPNKPWSITLEIAPVRIHIEPPVGWGDAETFDL